MVMEKRGQGGKGKKEEFFRSGELREQRNGLQARHDK